MKHKRGLKSILTTLSSFKFFLRNSEMKTNFSDLSTLNLDCFSMGASPVAFSSTTTFSGGAGESISQVCVKIFARALLPLPLLLSCPLFHFPLLTNQKVGPSGSGKSTISDLILRFYDPEEGSIAIGGKDIRQVNVHELRSKIAVVQQEPFLFSGTIGDNIRYGNPQADQAALEKAAREAFAHDFISQFPNGYNEQIGSGGRQLSGGQKQRIAIARAILKRPEILIMDEATSALDTESEFHLQKSLAELIKKHNMTVLVIAHRMSTIKDADKIYVLQRGRVREEGSHSELLARNGVYAELFRLSGSHKS